MKTDSIDGFYGEQIVLRIHISLNLCKYALQLQLCEQVI